MSKIEELIAKYQLLPHPEGGWYRETYRCSSELTSPVNGCQRSAVTQIYFLLPEGDISRLHKVCHDEIWHFYAGAPLYLYQTNGDTVEKIVLGDEQGEYHHVVPANFYQAAESSGKFTFVGCTVAPGFDFEDFAFMSDDEEFLPQFEAQFAQYKRLI